MQVRQVLSEHEFAVVFAVIVCFVYVDVAVGLYWSVLANRNVSAEKTLSAFAKGENIKTIREKQTDVTAFNIFSSLKNIVSLRGVTLSIKRFFRGKLNKKKTATKKAPLKQGSF